ncbi:MAG: hypothetical protein DHS20C15_16960 [Planctomycetota bacterium]|nr:MAG: hypothetical protein DHS20C15_16960 [Planctomycetota bacterium]
MSPSKTSSPPEVLPGFACWVPLIVALVVWAVWTALMQSGARWGLFADNWFMSVTMVFGSFVAGATSEGGGAVAFPVMTLGFDIAPDVARDFSLMIQSVGMTAASITIFALRVRIVSHALVWASLGGAAGVILGLEFIAPLLPPDHAKMLFTSTWLAFAFALYWINRYREREVHLGITHFLPRHALLLLGTGVVGGVISSITGSGLDIATFSLLVLRLRICESVATPTSVVLMGGNALVGALWQGNFGSAPLSAEAWDYWWCAAPVVVVGAPVGAWFIKTRSRHFMARLLYTTIGAQFFAALFAVPLTPLLVLFSLAVLAAGVFFFDRMARRGVRRLEWLSETGKPPAA